MVADKYRRKLMTGKAGTEPLAVASGSYTQRSHSLPRAVPYLFAPSALTEFAVGFIRPDEQEFP
jgi:hypothetical protein